jgi:hypothetical protein
MNVLSRCCLSWVLCATLATLAAGQESVRPLEAAEEVPSGDTAESVPAADARPESKTVITRQTLFSIPFQIDASDGDEPQVQLFVSENDGRTWRQAATADPKQRSSRSAPPATASTSFRSGWSTAMAA